MRATQVVPGVWRAGTRYVNWYVVDSGNGLTIVDAGLPGYRDQLDGVLATIGRRRSDVRALLLTHGHVDHTGFADLLDNDGATVHLHADDIALAANPRHNRTQRSVARYLHWPATVTFLTHAVRHGALGRPRTFTTLPLKEGCLDGVPGGPRVIHTPGHTPGSVVFEFPGHGVLFVGDLLCTISMVTGRGASPRLQSRGSNLDSDQAMQSLGRLHDVAGRTVLPGHGPPWHDGVEAAAHSARTYGCY